MQVDMMPAVSKSARAEDAVVFLQVAGITKWYGEQRALADVSFDIRRGEILGLIGPNGSGKTTLLETVAGLLPVDAGSVLWQRSALPQHRRRDVIFYLPDGVRPWDGQHLIHVLEFFASAFGRRASELDEVTRSVGLEQVLGRHVCALSKGYARRLMLALALLTPHPVVLMDEPFDGFDIRQTREMMALMRRMAARSPWLFISSPTPNASVTGSFCSRMGAYAGLVRSVIFACEPARQQP